MRKDCRFCHTKDRFKLLIDLGKQPSQGAYLLENQLGKEKVYPLRLFKCQNCGLVQLLDIVNDELFQPYLSSVALSAHFQEYAKELIERFLKPGDFIVEFGSNDGVLLEPLQKAGMEVLGVEPDKRLAKIAIDKGLPTLINPFTDKIARHINRQAKMVLANNVFAHIDEMDTVIKGIELLLEDGGLFIFEVHNLLNILVGMQYDNIYFEHVNYYTISSLAPFLAKYNLEIIEVKPITTHGGSFRIYAQKISKDVLSQFKKAVVNNKKELVGLLKSLKAKNKKIIGYGAAGRANTLLNYCKIGTQYIDYIIDESPSRYGRFCPGSHIPIIPPAEADLKKADYIMILAWNYAEEIITKVKEKGFKGQFIIPLPEVRIV